MNDMNRRQAIITVGTSAFGFLGLNEMAKGDFIRRPDTKGFIVIHQEVGNMPPWKVEVFVERLASKLSPKKPEGWHFIIQPTRTLGTGKVEVFAFNKDEISTVEKFVFDKSWTTRAPQEKADRQQLQEYVLAMLGAPVIGMPDNIIQIIDHFADRGEKFNVEHIRQFVIASIMDVMRYKNIKYKKLLVLRDRASLKEDTWDSVTFQPSN